MYNPAQGVLARYTISQASDQRVNHSIKAVISDAVTQEKWRSLGTAIEMHKTEN
jgi:hypothetical protein